jgi:hypothetical protein
MDTEDVKSFLKKVVPWIGAAATGNVPALVGLAASAVSGALGTDIGSSTNEIVKAVAGATPEQLIALRSADLEFELNMREFGYKEATEMYATEVADRNGARDREIRTGDSTNRILAYAIVSVWAVLNSILLVKEIPSGSEQIVARLLGTLDAALMVMLYFYYGSSNSSNRKTELMSDSKK